MGAEEGERYFDQTISDQPGHLSRQSEIVTQPWPADLPSPISPYDRAGARIGSLAHGQAANSRLFQTGGSSGVTGYDLNDAIRRYAVLDGRSPVTPHQHGPRVARAGIAFHVRRRGPEPSAGMRRAGFSPIYWRCSRWRRSTADCPCAHLHVDPRGRGGRGRPSRGDRGRDREPLSPRAPGARWLGAFTPIGGLLFLQMARTRLVGDRPIRSV